MFVSERGDDDWTEVTAGGRPAVRLAAPDLRHAQRARARMGAANDVILDVTVFVAADFRSARAHFAGSADSPQYVGTVGGLVGLVSDIFMAGVADGVTLIPAVAGLDVRVLAAQVLARLSRRLPVAAYSKAS
jgi:hypothetical protein